MPVVPTLQSYAPEQAQAPRLGAESFGGQEAAQLQKAGETGVKIGENMKLLNFFANRSMAKQNEYSLKAQSSELVNSIVNDPNSLQRDPKTGQLNGITSYQNSMNKILDGVQKQTKDPELQGMNLQYSQRIIEQHAPSLVKALTAKAYDADVKSTGALISQSWKDGDESGLVKGFQDMAKTKNFDANQSQEFVDKYFQNEAFKSVSTDQIPQRLEVMRKYVSPEVADAIEEKEMRRIKTADGRVADAKASKDFADNIKLMAQDNPSQLAHIKDEDLKNLTAKDHADILPILQKQSLGVPLNENQKVLASMIALGRKADAPDPKADPEDARSYSADNLAQNKWCFEQFDALDNKLKTRENMQKIIEQSEKPTLFFDENGSKIDKAYKAASAKKLQEDAGWWQKKAFPQGTMPLEAYNGKEGSFAAIPIGKGHYQIYDLSTKSNVGTATEKQVNGNTEQ